VYFPRENAHTTIMAGSTTEADFSQFQRNISPNVRTGFPTLAKYIAKSVNLVTSDSGPAG
jgi:hypothetical protein